MLKNQKAISRERLIGISFVDILIQAVFILFLALTVGYTDPMNLYKIKEYEQAGRDLCNKVNKDSVVECREVIDPIIDRELIKLALCIKPESSDRTVVTARFIVISPTETKFLGFTPQYFTYLEKKGDTERLAKAKSIAPGVYGVNSINQNFSFLMEPNCIHTIYRDWQGTWDRRQLDQIFAILYRLGGRSN